MQVITAKYARLDDTQIFDTTRLNLFINLVTGQVAFLSDSVGNLSVAVNGSVISTAFLLVRACQLRVRGHCHPRQRKGLADLAPEAT
jgi:hypothetical protein